MRTKRRPMSTFQQPWSKSKEASPINTWFPTGPIKRFLGILSWENTKDKNWVRCYPWTPLMTSTLPFYQLKINHQKRLYARLEKSLTKKLSHSITKSRTKSCRLDPIPTSLLKSSLNALVATLTRIINLSLQTAVFPSEMKCAVVTPLLAIGISIQIKTQELPPCFQPIFYLQNYRKSNSVPNF